MANNGSSQKYYNAELALEEARRTLEAAKAILRTEQGGEWTHSMRRNFCWVTEQVIQHGVDEIDKHRNPNWQSSEVGDIPF